MFFCELGSTKLVYLLEVQQTCKHETDGTLAWERPSLDKPSRTEGKGDFSAMTTFSLQRPAALTKVIVNFIEWSAHHLAPFNVLETPSKLA